MTNCREISDYNRLHKGSGELTPSLRLGAGACAGIVAMSATYPLDMVRGRLTVQEGRNVQYSGIWHATRTIMKQVGPLAGDPHIKARKLAARTCDSSFGVCLHDARHARNA